MPEAALLDLTDFDQGSFEDAEPYSMTAALRAIDDAEPRWAPPRSERIMFGVVHGDTRHSTFDDSKDALIAYDRANEGFLNHPNGRCFVRAGTDGLVAARNTAVEALLDSDADWLFWADSDMGFEPDTLSRLRAFADPADRPIVGALCFASRQVAHDGLNGYRTRPLPTVYDWAEVDGQPVFISQPLYPVNALMRVAGTGSACILIHRSVFEKLESQWYTRVPGSDGKLLGEDISFCVRAGAADFPIYVHTGIRTSHVKPQWVSEADHWRHFVAPPAVERCAVRVDESAPPEFWQSLLASTGLATGITGAETGEEPWVFLARPEHRFRPGWLDHAQHVAQALDAEVIGVNDLAPPAQRGEWSSGYLVRRSFYAEHAGRFLAAAVERGAYAIALGSVVELTYD